MASSGAMHVPPGDFSDSSSDDDVEVYEIRSPRHRRPSATFSFSSVDDSEADAALPTTVITPSRSPPTAGAGDSGTGAHSASTNGMPHRAPKPRSVRFGGLESDEYEHGYSSSDDEASGDGNMSDGASTASLLSSVEDVAVFDATGSGGNQFAPSVSAKMHTLQPPPQKGVAFEEKVVSPLHPTSSLTGRSMAEMLDDVTRAEVEATLGKNVWGHSEELDRELLARGILPVLPEDIQKVEESQHSGRLWALRPLKTSDGTVRCNLLRNKSGRNRWSPKWELWTESGVLIMTAFKAREGIVLGLRKGELERGDPNRIGVIKPNKNMTEFLLYDDGYNPDKHTPHLPTQQARRQLGLCHIKPTFATNSSKKKGPRGVCVATPRVLDDAGRTVVFRPRDATDDGSSLAVALDEQNTDKITTFVNKRPTWDWRYQAYTIDFHGRVTERSVKSFLLENSNAEEVLLFGKVGDNAFNLDFCHPFSPVQAMFTGMCAFLAKK